ncbi:unnamed protein product [Caenorhabditis bovis]|uniref:RecA family profile 1 domain-containing protein n=1 Tax=Caenorhabditis bovis TaxID=2654633 RepID=A0A8S1ET01_9PELO|nr:unnamed protein product [Caenorhabditis bovis]
MEVNLDYEEETAWQFLLRKNADGLFLKSCVPELDSILCMASGKIYEIDGEIGSGKTQICYSIVAKLLNSKKDAMVGWLSPTALRTDDLQKHLNAEVPLAFGIPGIFVDFQLHLDSLFCAICEDVDELKKCVDSIVAMRDSRKVRLVVVENIDTILHDTVYIDYQRGYQYQERVIEKFNLLAKNGITVIVTNHITRWRGYPAPALGRFWSSKIANRFFVEKTDETRVISKRIDGGDEQVISAKFRITSNGLEFSRLTDTIDRQAVAACRSPARCGSSPPPSVFKRLRENMR